MRLRKIQGAEEKVATTPFVAHDIKENKGRWHEIFGNNNPIHIEIGMGKGKFITTLSKQFPEINFLGMEKFSSVMVRAVEKREADPEPNTNLLFLAEDAAGLTEFFAEGEIDRIYLNFSDPWPKAKHARRRLTSSAFLELYDKILSKDGKLIFKTDNEGLFDFSLEEIQAFGWKVSGVTRDLHRSEFNEGNVMTEYEEKFEKLGKRICRLEACR